MADLSPVGWDTSDTTRGALEGFPATLAASATTGQNLGQSTSVVHALRGLDINDPASMNTGVASLVRAGADTQALALVKLAATRDAMGGGIQDALSQIAQSIQQANGSASGQTSQPGAPAQADPTASHAQDTMTQASQAVDQLLATPPAQRQAVFGQIRQDFIQRGVPSQAIDAVQPIIGNDAALTDLKTHYDQFAQHFGSFGPNGQPPPAAAPTTALSTLPGVNTPPTQNNALTGLAGGPGGQPDAAPSQAPPLHPTTAGWAQNLIATRPDLLARLNVSKSLTGIDTGIPDMIERMAAPEIAAEAGVRNAAALAAEGDRGHLAYLQPTEAIKADMTPPAPGATPLFDVNGNHAGWRMANGAVNAISSVASASSSGSASGSAPYQTVTVTGPHGEPTTMTVQGAHDAALKNNGVVSAGPAIETATDLHGQASALSDAATAATGRLAQAPQSIAQGMALLGLANAVGTGAYTSALQNVTKYLPGHTPQQYAANAGLLSSDLAATFRQELGGLAVPRVAIEANKVIGAIPTSTSPQDQVKVYAASALAANQFQQAHDRFIQSWAADTSKPRSFAAADAAWQAGPGAASLYSMPAFQNLTVAGKPAVDTYQHNGHTFLVPFPGLLGKSPQMIPVK